MRIAKLCLVFLAIASCVLIRSTYQTASRPDLLFTLWAIACNATTCLIADGYFRRSNAGRLSMGHLFAATAVPTLGIVVPMAAFNHLLDSSAWTSYRLTFCAMLAGLVPVLFAWSHWGVWFTSGGTGTSPPNLSRVENPEDLPPFNHWAWRTCKYLMFSAGGALSLWTLATDSGTSLYAGLGEASMAWLSLWLAGTYFRRVFYGKPTEGLYLAEISFSLEGALCFLPIAFQSYLPPTFTPGVWLTLFGCFAAAGPALMALLVQVGLDIQKSNGARETSNKTPIETPSGGNNA